MAEPLVTVADRSFAVPPGHVVRTGYVDVFKVRHACRARMAVGDVGGAYQKRIQSGEASPFPCPNGHWDGDVFVIEDGRHEHVAAMMIGIGFMLVAWIEPAAEGRGSFPTSRKNAGSKGARVR